MNSGIPAYQTSEKSRISDELINSYLLRPAAWIIVRLVYRTPVTPNHLTIASIIAGSVAAYWYLQGTPSAVAVAGLFVTLKDLLDSADGQLARARGSESRLGRFLDSFGDVLVNALVFTSIGIMLYRSHPSVLVIMMSIGAFIGITLRVSYHVFYQVSYLHLEDRYTVNKVRETFDQSAQQEDSITRFFHRMHFVIYDWQDNLFQKLDRHIRGEISNPLQLGRWYGDRTALRLSGFNGFGTELMLLTVCSLFNQIFLYLILNCLLMNGIMIAGLFYRRFVLRNRLLA